MRIFDTQIVMLPSWARLKKPSWITQESYRLQRNYAHPQAHSIHLRTSLKSILNAMDSGGIAKALIFGYPWNNTERCIKNNVYVANALNKYPDRFKALGVVNLNSSKDKIIDEAKRCIEYYGFSGFKLKPQWQLYSLSDQSKLEPLLNVVRTMKHPLIFTHVSQAYDKPMGDSLAEFLIFSESNPDITVIAGHLGGMLPFYYPYSKVRKKISNAFINTSLGTVPELIKAVLDVFPVERVLFGSDFPFYESKHLANAIIDSGISHQAANLILYDNAKELLL